ncbi:MAG: ATP-binding protein [Myxococcota bacterium]
MEFSAILGHERPTGILRRSARADRFAHAYLFQGPGGVGKRTVADAFAAFLLCESARDDDACGGCASCAKLRAGTHPDLHLLELPEGRSRIPIELFHALEARLQLAAHQGSRRVAIVDPADRLSIEAQHAFLKSLEEPRPDTIFILVTSRPSALVVTILSRCQRIGFGPIPAPVLREALAGRFGIDEGRAGMLAAIARGSLGRALALNDDKVLSEMDTLLEKADAAATGLVAPGLEWSESVRGTEEHRAQAMLLLDLLLLGIRDVMVLASGGAQADVAHAGRAEKLGRQAALPGAAQRAGAAYARVLEAQRDIRGNVNPALALQGMFTGLAACLHPSQPRP